MANKKTEEIVNESVVAEPKGEKTVKKTPVVKADKAQEMTMKISVFDVTGKATGDMTLPESVFGGKINKPLLAQAVRVYLANQRSGTASTQSRGEVDLTTAKWYRQKGTGRARHGAKSAPIFVKGGVAHGPKPHDFSLDLPKKMRLAALISALSSKQADGNVIVINDLATITPKTKNVVSLLKTLGVPDTRRKTVFVVGDKSENIIRASRNIDGVTYLSVSQLSAYPILEAKKLIFAKDTIELLEKKVA
jgi:large subunit ribosomal protein L4